MIIDKIREMGDNLKLLEGHDRLHYLIDKANGLEPLPEPAKTEENRIRGCASKLWQWPTSQWRVSNHWA